MKVYFSSRLLTHICSYIKCYLKINAHFLFFASTTTLDSRVLLPEHKIIQKSNNIKFVFPLLSNKFFQVKVTAYI